MDAQSLGLVPIEAYESLLVAQSGNSPATRVYAYLPENRACVQLGIGPVL